MPYPEKEFSMGTLDGENPTKQDATEVFRSMQVLPNGMA